MNPPVAIICPDYPPRPGGVSDYTALLVSELVRHTRVQLFTSPGTATPPAEVRVEHVSDWQNEEAVFNQINQGVPAEAALLWEYVPHMYGRGGVAPAVPRVIQRLRTPAHGPQVVLAHEIAAPWSWMPNRAWYAWAHRQQWQGIVGSADAVVTSTEAWCDEWRTKLPEHQAKFSYAASPSTIPVMEFTSVTDMKREWRAQRGWSEDTLVLGWFGTASAAKQLDWVLAVWRRAQAAGKDVALILIGKAEEVAKSQNSPRIQSTGYASAPEVSLVLQSIDLLLLPFIDGVSERRTSFMAGLAHGTPVATTEGHNTGATLRRAGICGISPADELGTFVGRADALLADSALRMELGGRGREFYRRHYDWPVVVGHLLQQFRREALRK